VPGNVIVDTHFGDREATDRAFAEAGHVVRMKFHIARCTAVAIEPRAALASYDARSGRYTLYAGGGGAVRYKKDLASLLGIEPRNLRVVCRDVGGNFGSKNRVYVEYGLALWASRKLGRPVKFTASRSEAFLSDYQGRTSSPRSSSRSAATENFSRCEPPTSPTSARAAFRSRRFRKDPALSPAATTFPPPA